MMGTTPLGFAKLLLCLQLIVDRTFTTAQSTNSLRIRELQIDEDTVQELVGGTVADATLYPAFTFFANGECAGTLISPTRVLTAAHCVQSGHPATVRVGATNRTDGMEVGVRCALSHPLYVWPNFQYDLAVLKLEEPINDVEFPRLNQVTDYPSFEGQELTVVGLGRNFTAGYVADNLMQLDYAFVPDNQCKSTYGDDVSLGLHICAAGIRQGSCFGDAGGPLFDNIEPIELIGVVTGASGGCADNKVEDVYADVAAFYDWILSQETDDTCNRACVGCFCSAFEYMERFGTRVSTSLTRLFDP